MALTLFSIKQKENEQLRGYIRRFTLATLEVSITLEEVLITALSQGLRGGEFFKAISLDPPRSFDEALRRAERYINLEEAQRTKMAEVTSPNDKANGREETRKMGAGPSRQEAVPEGMSGNRRIGPRFDEYAPLVTTPLKILMTIEKHPMLKWPKTYSEVPRKSPAAGSFCRFHNDYGHSTDDCQPPSSASLP